MTGRDKWDSGQRREFHEQIKIVATDAANKAIERTVPMTIEKTLTTFGIDVTNPIEIQQDHAFLRQTRKRCESVWTKIVMIAVAVFTTGSLGVMWAGLRSKFFS